MYSEALQIMDENTVSYMIDELMAHLTKQKVEKDAVISQKDAEIQRLQELIGRLSPCNPTP